MTDVRPTWLDRLAEQRDDIEQVIHDPRGEWCCSPDTKLIAKCLLYVGDAIIHHAETRR